RAAGHDVAEQRTLDGLDLALALTHATGGRRRVGGRALAVALLAQHGGVHLDLLGDAGGALVQSQGHADERVRAGLHAAAGTAATSASPVAAEERLEHVAQASAAEATTEAAAVAGARRGIQRVPAHVDDPALLGI